MQGLILLSSELQNLQLQNLLNSLRKSNSRTGEGRKFRASLAVQPSWPWNEDCRVINSLRAERLLRCNCDIWYMVGCSQFDSRGSLFQFFVVFIIPLLHYSINTVKMEPFYTFCIIFFSLSREQKWGIFLHYSRSTTQGFQSSQMELQYSQRRAWQRSATRQLQNLAVKGREWQFWETQELDLLRLHWWQYQGQPRSQQIWTSSPLSRQE